MIAESTETLLLEFQGVKLTERRIFNFKRRIGITGSIQEHVPHLGECHEWQGLFHRSGYGQFHVRGRRCDPTVYILAHRLAWFLEMGEIPQGMGVLHKCDNRKCTRIDHLFLGDQKANGEDMAAKNRSGSKGEKAWQRRHPERIMRGKDHPRWGKDGLKGESHPSSKLNDEKVVSILTMYATGDYSYPEIASVFSVSNGTVQQIIQRKIWSHIPFDGELFVGYRTKEHIKNAKHNRVSGGVP